MRDPKRIKRILSLLEKMWSEPCNEDMRFGQFLINIGVAQDDIRTWTMEDKDLLKGLEAKKNRTKQ